MSLDKQELRQRLEAVAAQVSAPRLTVEGLVRRIRRRRARIIGLVSGSLLAVAAIAVAVPIGLSLTSTGPALGPSASPEKLPFSLSYTVAVNGQSVVFPKNGTTPSFTVTPGEDLRINVDVIVPAHARVAALWLGISKGILGSGPKHRPIGINYPMLAHTRRPLGPGSHRFRLRWTVPAGLRPGASRLLAAAWYTRQGVTADVAEPIVTLIMR